MKPRTLLLAGAVFAFGTMAEPTLTQQHNIINFTQVSHSQWQAMRLYRQGDIVTHREELYIAYRPVIGKAPQPNETSIDGWIWVRKAAITRWQFGRYEGGELVKHGPYFYLARHHTGLEPGRSNHWLKFTDLFYPIPEIPDETPEDFATLEGQDLNENGIRDDYERAIYTRYSEPELIEYALKMAPAFARIIEIYQKGAAQFSADENADAIERLVNGRLCTMQLKRHYPDFKSPQVNYYNSWDRAWAKRDGTDDMAKQIPEDHPSNDVGSMECNQELLEKPL